MEDLDLLQSLRNCNRVCLKTVVDDKKPKSSGLYGGIQGRIEVFKASAKDSFAAFENTGSNDSLMTFSVVCHNRGKGDMKVVLLDTNRCEVASFQRTERRSLIARRPDMTIPVRSSQGEHLATISPAMTTKHGLVESQDYAFATLVPAWQAATKWLCFAFLCFVPTFGLGGCLGFYKASTAIVLTSITKKTTSDQEIKLPDAESKGSLTLVDFGQVSSKSMEKLVLLVLFGFLKADEMTDPPKNNTTGGSVGSL
jgi:hypothetical protein